MLGEEIKLDIVARRWVDGCYVEKENISLSFLVAAIYLICFFFGIFFHKGEQR